MMKASRIGLGAAIVVSLALLARPAAPSETIAPRPSEARALLLGNWADPTILKDGDDYYMTHSSFEFQPGLLIWHSKDLRAWKPIAHAVVNQKGSIWAPELVKHGGRYYIYYPAAGTNWVVTAEKITGPWSEPVSIGVGRIDPGHVVGDDGRRYLHLSGGHAVELSDDGVKALAPSKRVYDGWPIPPDWTIECFCLESPKLTRRGGWYYLTSAEGGTSGPATSHMVVSARSRDPLGPWENSPHNPVIRTWNRDEPWWSKGHGTLVEGPDKNWFCVLHGYMNGVRTQGRCTLIEPIEWTSDGWFRTMPKWPDGWNAPAKADMPMSDDFKGETLGIQWQAYRKFDPRRVQLTSNRLTIEGLGQNPGESQPVSLMPMHRRYEVQVDIEIEQDGTAGLMLFGAPNVYLGLSIGSDGKLHRVQDGFRRYANTDEPSYSGTRVTFRIVNDMQDVRFYYERGGSWVVLQPGMDVSSMTTAGWHALRPGFFVTGAGRGHFRAFRYTPLEDK